MAISEKFKACNVIIAEHQDEYQSLPAVLTEDGKVITKWRLTWRERLYIALTGHFYWAQWKGDGKLQPVYPEICCPSVDIREGKTVPVKERKARKKALEESDKRFRVFLFEQFKGKVERLKHPERVE